ncbi:hypothetical protein C8R44DRAFT_738248 [Mycena epipterygia]|nr:hypothetical protein C8R44DRAFT_738248 [Mycena epipterygia]
MSRALKIPEIVDAIFAEKNDGFPWSKRPLAALARTCRAFHDPALHQLWRSQNTLHNLIRCLPRDLWEEIRVSRQLPGFSTQNWGLLATIALNMPQHVLLPNLRALRSSGAKSEADYPSLRLLLNPGLKRLSWPLPITSSNLSLLPILARDCPLLTTLDVSHSALGVLPKLDSIHLQCLALSRFTRALNHLEDVILEQVDHLAFDHLACLPNLRSISIIMPRKLAPNTSTAQINEPPRFEALRNLELRISDLEAAVSYFPAFSNCRLDTVRISTNRLAMNTTIAALYAAVSSHVVHDTLRILDIGGPISSVHPSLLVLPIPAPDDIPQYLVNGHALHPLFDFSYLTSLTLCAPVGFDIDDDTAWLMAAAWSRLTYLHIERATSVSHPPSLTLYGLSAFAWHCLALQRLEIAFDARHVPQWDTTTEIRILQKSLDELQVGTSPLHDPPSVAKFLSGIFAGPVEIEYGLLGNDGEFQDERNVDEETRRRFRLWDKVSEFLSVMEEAREEERNWARMGVISSPRPA